jgi:cystathionine gamma-synthase
MNAIYSLHRVLQRMLPGRKSVQFGFPYVDTLKILEKFGPGAHFFRCGDDRDLDALHGLLEREPIGGLFTEYPSNPLLATFDLSRLAGWSRQYRFPLVIDDTIAGYANVDLLPVADVVCSSLTKLFSGVGDVAAGALVLNPRSPFHSELRIQLKAQVEDLLWPADAVVLEANSRDYGSRVHAINSTAQELVEFLRHHPKVAAVYYPGIDSADTCRAWMRPGRGLGGVFSILLKDAPSAAPRFFDALRVSKGPSLGTNYTLACPYTILAHYQELDFAESCGVSRFLVRVSVGLEEASDLIKRFAEALRAC